MQDDEYPKHDDSDSAPEAPYPGHGPVADSVPVVDDSDHVDDEVEPKYPVTPGVESPEEREAIADHRRDEIAATHGADEDDEQDDDDDSVDEPAADSPIHGEDTVQAGSTDPTL